ncbi:MAG TPA: class I SAM-dependent methyltransferase [Bryobacteraceae bacterium]|jgi:ubiquinone/menaquinone biosynthesis C-methylase UbiE|nr:class I SAM-dependent methyltransferase [Bryobacteraceae bacterium]
MSAAKQSAFDAIAGNYDRIWSETSIGLAQRSAVWRELDVLFAPGDFVLDLGCGTGVDALHLQAAGISVYGIDSSPRMVEVSQSHGVNACCLSIEHLDKLEMQFNGAISNFGALNCLPSLNAVAERLARLVCSGGRLAVCFMGRLCLWEIGYYLLRAKPAKAFRRLRGKAESSIGATVFYHSGRQIAAAFKPYFHLAKSVGIGFAIPPSYVSGLSDWEVEQLSRIDNRVSHKAGLRSLADHRLYIFERL